MLTIRVFHDHDVECPSSYDGAWKLYSFNRRHRAYADPTTIGLSLSLGSDGLPKITNPGLRSKLKAGLAFFLSYFEHGQCVWFRHGDNRPGVEFRWDGVRVAGLLVWEEHATNLGARTYANRAKDADGFLADYTAWCNGDGYGFAIEDEEGEIVDSCGGYLGTENLAAGIADALPRTEDGDVADFQFAGDDYLASLVRNAVRKEVATV